MMWSLHAAEAHDAQAADIAAVALDELSGGAPRHSIGAQPRQVVSLALASGRTVDERLQRALDVRTDFRREPAELVLPR